MCFSPAPEGIQNPESVLYQSIDLKVIEFVTKAG